MPKIIFKFHINAQLFQLESYIVDHLIKLQRDYIRAWMYKNFAAYFETHMIEYSYTRITKTINDTDVELIFVVNEIDGIDYIPIIMYQIQWYIDHGTSLDRITSYEIYYED